jgi:hypothetical protein
MPLGEEKTFHKYYGLRGYVSMAKYDLFIVTEKLPNRYRKVEMPDMLCTPKL